MQINLLWGCCCCCCPKNPPEERSLAMRRLWSRVDWLQTRHGLDAKRKSIEYGMFVPLMTCSSRFHLNLLPHSLSFYMKMRCTFLNRELINNSHLRTIWVMHPRPFVHKNKFLGYNGWLVTSVESRLDLNEIVVNRMIGKMSYIFQVNCI